MKELIDTKAVCKILGCSGQTVRIYCHEEGLPFLKLTLKKKAPYKFELSDVLKWKEERKFVLKNKNQPELSN